MECVGLTNGLITISPLMVEVLRLCRTLQNCLSKMDSIIIGGRLQEHTKYMQLMNLVGEFSLICHLEILLQTFRLIQLLALQMMDAWAKETARLIFTEEFSIFKKKTKLIT